MKCRNCASENFESLVDFGPMPLANAYRHPDDTTPEETFPLHAYTCLDCGLVQVDHTIPPAALFADYAFFSSYSQPWIEHCRAYVQAVTARFGLNVDSRVIEIASNDGCLLACFDGPQVLGVDPAANVAKVAIDSGIPTVTEFFGVQVAKTLPTADLLIANNVLGHVPDLHDFTEGAALALDGQGVLTIEVPHLYRLLKDCEYDTIYHEHFSYFSFTTLHDLLDAHGLRVFDVQALPVHGGSMRVYAAHTTAGYRTTPHVGALLDKERAEQLDDPTAPIFATFAKRVRYNTDLIRRFFDAHKKVVGMGAPAKGNTLLNAAHITHVDMPFTTDTSEHKQGLLLPGSHIPIRAPDTIAVYDPDYLFVLAWNWAQTIITNFPGYRYAIPIPQMRVT